MKNCTDCTHANWKRTAKGALHPSGEGRCTFEVRIPVLPQAFYWYGSFQPKPYGGFINRREELKDHCAYWSSSPALRVSLVTKATGPERGAAPDASPARGGDG
jgi:hypothetical protein